MKIPQPKLKLKHSKVIKPMWSDYSNIETPAYREYRKTKSTIRGITTPRAIQMYRWWFRYLQLALELESLDFTFTEYRRIPAKGKKKGYDKPVQHKVVVNRDRYVDWDLDEVLGSNFDRWWKGHSDLFVEVPTHTTEITKPEDVVPDDHFRYFRIDTRMTTANSIRSLREQLDSKRRSTKWTSKWLPTGEVRQEKLFNSYNAMVMWLQGKTTEEILSSGLFRKSRGRETIYIPDEGGRGDPRSRTSKGQVFLSGRQSKAKPNMDRMKDLLDPGRRFVLIAADGYFAKHPRNKKYFGKSK